MEEKFCKFCGEKIPADAIICTKCGRQVETLNSGRENIIINNVASSSAASSAASTATNAPTVGKRGVSKWTSFALCLVGGYFGLHKFYEGKTGLGLVYLCTGGLFCIGWVVDVIAILGKPDPYEVI